MKKKTKLIIIIISIILVLTILTIFVVIPNIKKYQERKAYEEEQERIRNATVIVELKDNLDVPFYDNVKASDFITNINGEFLSNPTIDTTSLGKREVSFTYVNDEGIKIPYTYEINVVDNVAPSIWLNNTYTVYNTYDGDLVDDIVCADDYDDNPECLIEGDYDTSKNGSYKLKFIAKDYSGNENVKNFTLIVKDPPTTSSNTQEQEVTTTPLQEVIDKYKNDNTKIGIDVSGWQGDIDYEKVKDAGVEFVFIKVGGTLGTDGDYYVDSKFIQNIEGFNAVDIPVGIYFYSYAKTKDNVISDANWVIDQIKDYKVDLPVVYDWENWNYFNNYEQSFYTLSSNAKTFLDLMQENRYDSALYSSKAYLEKAWFDIGYPVWLAHYTVNIEPSNYEGNYMYWQLCEDGVVDGINTPVDIDVMYLNN